MYLSLSYVFDSSTPFLEWLCMGALTRQAEIAGTLIAVWPHRDWRLEYFHLQSQAFFRAFIRVSGFYSCFFFLLRHRLASFSEVFLSSLFIPDECLNMRMHSCFALHLFFRLARPLPFTAALKVIPLFTGSTVGCIPSMCECLKKGFGKIHLSCLVKRVCSAFTWPWNGNQ